MRPLSKFDEVGPWPGRPIPREPAREKPAQEGRLALFFRHWRGNRRKWALFFLAAFVVVGGVWLRSGAAPANYTTVPVGRGNVVKITTASGMVNPVETVQIGSYVSGRIADLYCDYNSKVVKGQRCAKIDARSYEANVQQATAALSTAKAQLAKDQANLDYAKLVHDRAATLSSRQVVSQDAAEKALNGFQQAQAQTALDRAMIQQREAGLKVARVNLDYTDIISPVDGTIVSRNVTIGQTVAASFQTPTLFIVATDLTHMQIDANVTEAAIGGVHKGQKATFTVAAFPHRTFNGVVTQVRQAPVSVQNVISYDVVIRADNRDLSLKPGMTATAHISVAERDNVVRVPEPAVRFAPGGLPTRRAVASRADDKKTVWALRQGKLVAIPVTVGLTGEDYVEITGGRFAADDRIVTGRKRPGRPQPAPSAAER